ncbi:hypothetical protein Hanom_Chr06g00527891 [Helianthus anomalus]
MLFCSYSFFSQRNPKTQMKSDFDDRSTVRDCTWLRVLNNARLWRLQMLSWSDCLRRQENSYRFLMIMLMNFMFLIYSRRTFVEENG